MLSPNSLPPPDLKPDLHDKTWRALANLYVAGRATMLGRQLSQWQSVKRHADAMTELTMARAEGRQPRPQPPPEADEMQISVGDQYHAARPVSRLPAALTAAVTAAGLTGAGAYYLADRAATVATPDPPAITDSNTIFFPLEP